MLDPKEYERLQRRFRSLNDKTLLNMLKNQRQDFRFEVLQLIKDELKLRGYHDDDFINFESESDSGIADPRNEDLTAVAKCPNEIVASQVMDLLSQNGICSTVLEGLATAKEIVGLQASWPDRGMTIVVASHDAERAKEILSVFPPLIEEAVSDTDLPDEP